MVLLEIGFCSSLRLFKSGDIAAVDDAEVAAGRERCNANILLNSESSSVTADVLRALKRLLYFASESVLRVATRLSSVEANCSNPSPDMSAISPSRRDTYTRTRGLL